MRLDCTINIDGIDYKFNSVDDDPLMFVMSVNDDYELIRYINCDIPFEKWVLVKKYKGHLNGIEDDKTFSDQVYHGRDISDEAFMSQLLKNVLFHIHIDGPEDIRTLKY